MIHDEGGQCGASNQMAGSMAAEAQESVHWSARRLTGSCKSVGKRLRLRRCRSTGHAPALAARRAVGAVPVATGHGCARVPHPGAVRSLTRHQHGLSCAQTCCCLISRHTKRAHFIANMLWVQPCECAHSDGRAMTDIRLLLRASWPRARGSLAFSVGTRTAATTAVDSSSAGSDVFAIEATPGSVRLCFSALVSRAHEVWISKPLACSSSHLVSIHCQYL